ncbi:hypothetical protein J6590_013592 [Homalodisca vitripennis]|nr:hypothetical protein J6590_013592 [Homalodisca vitripennis]
MIPVKLVFLFCACVVPMLSYCANISENSTSLIDDSSKKTVENADTEVSTSTPVETMSESTMENLLDTPSEGKSTSMTAVRSFKNNNKNMEHRGKSSKSNGMKNPMNKDPRKMYNKLEENGLKMKLQKINEIRNAAKYYETDANNNVEDSKDTNSKLDSFNIGSKQKDIDKNYIVSSKTQRDSENNDEIQPNHYNGDNSNRLHPMELPPETGRYKDDFHNGNFLPSDTRNSNSFGISDTETSQPHLDTDGNYFIQPRPDPAGIHDINTEDNMVTKLTLFIMERGRVFLLLCVCITLVTRGKLKQAPELQFSNLASDDIPKSNNSDSFKNDLTPATEYPMKETGNDDIATTSTTENLLDESSTDDINVPSMNASMSTTENLLNQISTEEIDTLSSDSSTTTTNNPLNERNVEKFDVLSSRTDKPVNGVSTGEVDVLLKSGLTLTPKNLLTESNSASELNVQSKKIDTRSYKTSKKSSMTSRLKKNSATQNRRRRVHNSKKSNRDSASRKIKKISYNKEYENNKQAKLNAKPINKNGYNDGDLILRENYLHFVHTKKPSSTHQKYKRQAEAGAVNEDQPDLLTWDPPTRLHQDTDSKYWDDPIWTDEEFAFESWKTPYWRRDSKNY